ncbi:MAG: imidazole glycerol phosphate synthase subunit HisH [Candidatus Gorgyraea atricola]|nr:imidazole glycerol phosphate synthase subunit HisH [Candidatus Gorgyraea atricola]
MIVVIDYGMGNLRSVQKAVELFCPDVKVTSSSRDILAADKIILPGVGAFSNAMEELRKRGLIKAILETIKKGKPFLGICLGLQLLFSESEEGGRIKGLDVLKGKVKRFNAGSGLKIPHMGWNQIGTRDPIRKSEISYGAGKGHPSTSLGTGGTRALDGVADGSFMYFVHSYYVEPEDRSMVLCETDYGVKFTSGIQKDNIYAFQFHPEKSQGVGLKIVENFVKL